VIRRRLVRVPASSANLGPGFDCMAAALTLALEVEVEETGQFAVRTDLPVGLGRENLCVRAFERLHPADGFTFTIRSQIPLSGGLGSSAAAIVAGLMAADHLFELDADLLAHATIPTTSRRHCSAASSSVPTVRRRASIHPPAWRRWPSSPPRRCALAPRAQPCPSRCRCRTPSSTSLTRRC